MSFAQSYFGQLRQLVGPRLLLIPAARIVIEDDAGRVLMQQRSDFGTWGVPGGVAEAGESAETLVIRETLEETGLTIEAPQVFGHASDPVTERIRYPQGGEAHFHVLLFWTTYTGGELAAQDNETVRLDWFSLDALPPMLPNMQSTLAAWVRFKQSGAFQLA